MDPGGAEPGLLRCRNLVGRVGKYPDPAGRDPRAAVLRSGRRKVAGVRVPKGQPAQQVPGVQVAHDPPPDPHRVGVREMKGAQEEAPVSTGGQKPQANRSAEGSAYAATNSVKSL